MRKIGLLGVVVIVMVSFYVYLFHPCINGRGKFAHISIDDVKTSFYRLAKDSSRYSSLFEEDFFSFIKEIHDETGCKFTLYAYFVGDSAFCLDEMPLKFKKEFQENDDWLKIGFHAARPSRLRPQNADFAEFKTFYTRMTSSIIRFAGVRSLAKILRLDFYYATPEEVGFLRDSGIEVLLSSDDDRRSYQLPPVENEQLLKENSIRYEGVKYLRTNIRIENTDIPYMDIVKNQERDTIVIFTHEWKLNRVNKYKLKRTIKILKDCNYNFICE